jgi:hypothetical protein
MNGMENKRLQSCVFDQADSQVELSKLVLFVRDKAVFGNSRLFQEDKAGKFPI